MSVVAGDPYAGENGGRMAWSNKEDRYEEAEDFDSQERASKGCWATFSGCVGSMWATRQMTQKEDREVYVRTTLRELVIYILFLTISCIITFGMTSQTMFYYTKVLKDLFMDTPFPDTKNTFRGSTQVLDYWRFLDVLVDGLYWEKWYDPKQTEITLGERNILYENRMLGVPRMRQIRVRNDSCTVPVEFQSVIPVCYEQYDSEFEDKTPFGDKDGPEWKYHSKEDLDTLTHWGKIGSVYSGAGSYLDFNRDKNSTKDKIRELREKLWVDRNTRAVFVDFTVYNANINLFCIVTLMTEFPATGGIITTGSFRTVKLLRYVTPLDHFVLGCEFVFCFFIVYYIIEEVLEILAIKLNYFKSVWNVLDCVVIILCLVCIGLNVFSVLTINSKLEQLLSEPDKYADFLYLGYYQNQFNTAVSICVFFSWFKLFKYISFNKTMTQLSSTLSRCAKDVVGFAVMFFIVFFAFAQLGYLLFGTQVHDFSTFIGATFTLLRTILGDFNFQEIENAERILGPIFFLSYVFFVFFVLLNMFLAIINDTYSEVKAEINLQRNEFEIADYFLSGYNNVLGKFGRRNKQIDISNALKSIIPDDDGTLSFDQVRTALKKYNFSDTEVQMFFARYDNNCDRKLNKDEVEQLTLDLANRTTSSDGSKPKVPQPRPESAALTGGAHVGACDVNKDDFVVICGRVEHMEHSIGSIVSKIDVVLYKLDAMEKSKGERKEKMGRAFDELISDDDDGSLNIKNATGEIIGSSSK